MPLCCIIVLDAMTPAHHVTNEGIGQQQDDRCYNCKYGNQLRLYSKVSCGNKASRKKPKEMIMIKVCKIIFEYVNLQ